MTTITEQDVENDCLKILKSHGYKAVVLSPFNTTSQTSGPVARESRKSVVLNSAFDSIKKLNEENEDVDDAAIMCALDEVKQLQHLDYLSGNRVFHDYLVNGVKTKIIKNGKDEYVFVKIYDFQSPENNDYLVVSQFEVELRGESNVEARRPDVLVFANGFPFYVIELKAPGIEDSAEKAFNQSENYKRMIPQLFVYNQGIILSDGYDATISSLTAPEDRFLPWRKVNGDKVDDSVTPFKSLFSEFFKKEVFSKHIQFFTLFEGKGKSTNDYVKIQGSYYQFYGVLAAIDKTVYTDDKRLGVFWHTQGSGKSYSMVFYSTLLRCIEGFGKVTILVITDRNDLDDQLYSTFIKHSDNLKATVKQITSKNGVSGACALADELKRNESGGVIFTTIHKFLNRDGGDDELSTRDDIVVLADEAHRSHYGMDDELEISEDEVVRKIGMAQAMRLAIPNARFLGFTGTPLNKEEKSTKDVFGDYVSIYTIQNSQDDKSTLPLVYLSSRVAMEEDNKRLEEIEHSILKVGRKISSKVKNSIDRKTLTLRAIKNHPSRLSVIAQDIVSDFEKRQSDEWENTGFAEGKAMIICHTREACVTMYEKIVELRPDWAGNHEDSSDGKVKVIFTSSSQDKPALNKYHLSKDNQQQVAERMRDGDDSLKMVIVCDMWLTGFDAPPVNILYLDKSLKEHSLMQALARANRIYKTKSAGYIIDYNGLLDNIHKAINMYSVMSDEETDVNLETEKSREQEFNNAYQFAHECFNGFDVDAGQTLDDVSEAIEYLHSKNRQESFSNKIVELRALISSVKGTESYIKKRGSVDWMTLIHACLRKKTKDVTQEEIDRYSKIIRKAIENGLKAVTTNNIQDIFKMDKIGIDILDDSFLEALVNSKFVLTSLHSLRKKLHRTISKEFGKDPIKEKSLRDKLEIILQKYNDDQLRSEEILKELVKFAKHLRTQKSKQSSFTSEYHRNIFSALEANRKHIKVDLLALSIDINNDFDDFSRNYNLSIRANRSHLLSRVRNIITKMHRSKNLSPSHAKMKKIAEDVVQNIKAT